MVNNKVITLYEDRWLLTHRYREQTSGYHWWEGKEEGQYRVRDFFKGYYGIIWNHVSETSKL